MAEQLTTVLRRPSGVNCFDRGPSYKMELNSSGSDHNNLQRSASHNLSAKERAEKSLLVETSNLLCAKKNCFKKGVCPKCEKRKFLFALYLRSQSQEEEPQERSCIKCLLKKVPKKSFTNFIIAQPEWSEATFRADLSQDLLLFADFCKSHSSNDPSEGLVLINSILNEKMKALLSANSDMVVLLNECQNRMIFKEKLLALKLVHDNTDCLLRLDQIIKEKSLTSKLELLSSAEQNLLVDEIRASLSKLAPNNRAREPVGLGLEFDFSTGSSIGYLKRPFQNDQDYEGTYLGKRQLPSDSLSQLLNAHFVNLSQIQDLDAEEQSVQSFSDYRVGKFHG